MACKYPSGTILRRELQERYARRYAVNKARDIIGQHGMRFRDTICAYADMSPDIGGIGKFFSLPLRTSVLLNGDVGVRRDIR